MRVRRVVVTGMGAVSPYGMGVETLFSALREGKSGIRSVPRLGEVAGLGPRVGGLAPQGDIAAIPRKIRRSMSPMSAFAYLAAVEALAAAGLEGSALGDGRVGVCVGSTMGSPDALERFFRQYCGSGGMDQTRAMTFFQVMGHTATANLIQALGLTGRALAPAAACSSGCQAIGLAYEAVAFGRQEAMLCGGAEEFHALAVGAFDLLLAASTRYNDRPEHTPRPFDKHRDGVVCSEGAGMLFLESLDSARERGAVILAEILGFSCLGGAGGLAEPSPESLAACMRAALADAGTAPEAIACVNAHATGTELGDIAECRAIAEVFGPGVPVSSLKGHMGHSLAAGGALESIAAIAMLREGLFLPTKNLEEPDERCSGVNLLTNPVAATGDTIVKNSFALGGINCALVLRGWHD